MKYAVEKIVLPEELHKLLPKRSSSSEPLRFPFVFPRGYIDALDKWATSALAPQHLLASNSPAAAPQLGETSAVTADGGNSEAQLPVGVGSEDFQKHHQQLLNHLPQVFIHPSYIVHHCAKKISEDNGNVTVEQKNETLQNMITQFSNKVCHILHNNKLTNLEIVCAEAGDDWCETVGDIYSELFGLCAEE